MAENVPPPSLSPYLTVRDGVAALDFYKNVFAGEETSRMMADDGRRVMHASIRIQGGTVMLSDEFLEYPNAVSAPKADSKPPVGVLLDYADPAEVDAVYERAIKAGAKSIMAPEDTFWGARFGEVADPFGHRWLLHATLKK